MPQKDRKHLAISPAVAKIVGNEVIKRNANREVGERAHTIRSVSEEIVVAWSKNEKWGKK